MSSPDEVYSQLDITNAEKEALSLYILQQLVPHPVKLWAYFELMCFTWEGIDAIKEALLTSKKEVCDNEF